MSEEKPADKPEAAGAATAATAEEEEEEDNEQVRPVKSCHGGAHALRRSAAT